VAATPIISITLSNILYHPNRCDMVSIKIEITEKTSVATAKTSKEVVILSIKFNIISP